MTEQDLRTLLRDHVVSTEPPFTLRPDDAITGIRARRTRRRIGIAAAGVAAAGIIVTTLSGDVFDSGGRGTGADALTQQALADYDAQEMPTVLDAHIKDALSQFITLGEGDFIAASDRQAQLPPRSWNQATSMTMRYGWTTDHRLRVRLSHSRSEAEGNKDTICESMTSGPEALLYSCDATTMADGTVVVTEVSAVYPDPTPGGRGMWIALTREDVEQGQLPSWAREMGMYPSRRLDPEKVFFQHHVEAIHSATFLTSASEAVQATSYDAALQKYVIPHEALVKLVTDPELVIPQPPA